MWIIIALAGLVVLFLGSGIIALIRKDYLKRKKERLKEEKVLTDLKNKYYENRDKLTQIHQEKTKSLNNQRRRLVQRESNLEKKIQQLDQKVEENRKLEVSLREQEEYVTSRDQEIKTRLGKIAKLSEEEAKEIVFKDARDKLHNELQIFINKAETEAEVNVDKKAKEILISSMQRIAAEVTSEMTISTLELPSEDMKGRIIGKEGRNIRSLEALTGVDILIDDTPEIVLISCFDPIRRTIAKQSLERLFKDGRIHPARIEEVVYQVSQNVQKIIYDEGEKVVLDLNIQGMHPELIRLLGRLHFRMSYGQNLLNHSKEVAIIGTMLAGELKLNKETVKRACLLHDIGKGVENLGELTHAIFGGELAKKYGENDLVVNGIMSHHNEINPNSLESLLVQVADTISASRPGVRSEAIENYVHRLRNLEKITYSFNGVKKCFAVQAGREIRIIINDKIIPEEEVKQLARNIAKKIREETQIPGHIKITLVRETRVVEYIR